MRWPVLAVVLAARSASADPATTPAPAPASPPAPTPSATLSINGYVEAFYQYNFNAPSNLVTAYRGFDDRTNSFTIDNAVLDVIGQWATVYARVALQVGHTPSSYYASEPTYAPVAGAGASDPETWRIIQQALIGYKPGDLLLEGGIFVSPIGIENLPIRDQWNWSRSNLFYALPYYHAGARATYPLSSTLTGTFMITNGWNDIVNRNRYPCLAGVLAWTPTPAVQTQFIYFGGVEPPPGTPVGQPWRNLFDATATWQVTPELQVAAQLDAGVEPDPAGNTSWYSGAAYARVHVLPKFYAAARVDYLHEHDAPNAPRLFFPAASVHSITVTADYRPDPHLSVRLEARDDRASAPMYFDGDVPVDTAGNDIPTATSQQTLTLGVVAWF